MRLPQPEVTVHRAQGCRRDAQACSPLFQTRKARMHTRMCRVQFVYGIYIRKTGVLARELSLAAEKLLLTDRVMHRAVRKFPGATPLEPAAASEKPLAALRDPLAT